MAKKKRSKQSGPTEPNTFGVSDIDGEWGYLICESCGNEFGVLRDVIKESTHYILRPCPYCFTASRLPGQ